MNAQFFLVAPAKAFLVPCTRAFRTIEHSGLTFAAWDDSNVYVKTKDTPAPRFAYQNTPGSNTYAVQIAPDVYCYAASCDNDKELFERVALWGKEVLPAWLEEKRAALADIPGYNEKQAARLEQARIEREAEKQREAAAQAEREAREASEKQAALVRAFEDFKNGRNITWELFEELCVINKVIMRPNTIGAGRRTIKYISKGGAILADKRRVPDGIWAAVRQLKAHILTD